MRTIIISILILFSAATANAQASLVLNGAIMSLNNNVYLVVDNPASSAFVRNSGHIVSEGENNNIQWNLGTTTGTYTVPWGYGTSNYLPVSFTKTAGAGTGAFVFSTYHTGWQNSTNLPSGITTFNGPSSSDNSAYVVDRFWKVNAQGYTTKPGLTNLVFTYLPVEYTVASNTIIESNLKAQRWNSSTNTWSDFPATGTVNTTAKTVTLSSVSAANVYPWWVLVDQNSTLPLNFLSFEARHDGNRAKLQWSTSGEVNVSSFEVQKSVDGNAFAAFTTQPAYDNITVNNYTAYDSALAAGNSFYRIKEIDRDGNFAYSVVRNLFTAESSSLAIYPNPCADGHITVDLRSMPKQAYQVSVHDISGRQLYLSRAEPGQSTVVIHLVPGTKAGMYVVRVAGGQSVTEQKIVVQ